MNMNQAAIGVEVVKAKGANLGVISKITQLDYINGRIKTDFGFWAKIDCWELASIPFEIVPGFMKKMKNKNVWVGEKYVRKG
jgi:hypothetical protein